MSQDIWNVFIIWIESIWSNSIWEVCNEIVFSHVAFLPWIYSYTEQLCALSASGGNTSLKVTRQIIYASQAFHQKWWILFITIYRFFYCAEMHVRTLSQTHKTHHLWINLWIKSAVCLSFLMALICVSDSGDVTRHHSQTDFRENEKSYLIAAQISVGLADFH